MGAGLRIGRHGLAWLLCLTAAGRAASDEVAGGPDALVAVGQLSRLDLAEDSVFIRSEGRVAELELRVDRKRTRLTWGGRLVRLEDLKTGERVIAVYAPGVPGSRRAEVLKLGASRYALIVPQATSP